MTEDQYEYVTKNASGKRGMQRLMNRMAKDGWEYVDQSRRGALQWGSGTVDITFRRPKRTAAEKASTWLVSDRPGSVGARLRKRLGKQ